MARQIDANKPSIELLREFLETVSSTPLSMGQAIDVCMVILKPFLKKEREALLQAVSVALERGEEQKKTGG